ncbi:MAG: citrate lyase acyl carrier protein [Clostridia bacterium]|nr:citrate lyase acyl carrier protein [Clostridia bacterium]MBP3652033.1 citrate lyase acyl carrier protein [Clostridia bacterium]
MGELVKRAVAGTMESSDAYVELEPGVNGIEIDIDSVVINQFGDQLREVVQDVLREQGVENAKVKLIDRGALDCVIRARVETAVVRAKGE